MTPENLSKANFRAWNFFNNTLHGLPLLNMECVYREVIYSHLTSMPNEDEGMQEFLIKEVLRIVRKIGETTPLTRNQYLAFKAFGEDVGELLVG